MKDTYIYPAIFDFADDGISISFPDISGCFSCADTTEEALNMANEALRGHLACMEADNDDIPEPTDVLKITVEPNQIIQLISVYMPPARANYAANQKQAVRRNITLPRWQNEFANRHNINVSAIVQNALEQISLNFAGQGSPKTHR